MPGHPVRKRMRLPGYDYTSPGAYFVTVCAHRRECVFGKIVDDAVRLSAAGTVVQASWLEIPHHFPHLDVDSFVVMPNHAHGILVVAESVGAKHASPLPPTGIARGTSPGSLSAVVQAFKAASTRRINLLRGTPGARVWQRGYFEHVVRSRAELDRLRRYIETNPLRWALDRENPSNT